jgi:MYXO-CTERM domain-containing protein
MMRHMAMAAAVAIGSVTVSASAAVVQLVGGDAGQGLTVDSSRVVYAVDFGGTNTVQGVTFGSSSSVVPDSSGTYSASGFFAAGETSSNDSALANVLSTGRYLDGSSGKIRVRNLTPGATYEFELLVAGAGGRTQSVWINNGPADSQALANNAAYNFKGTGVADSFGDVLVNMSASGQFANPVFGGLLVSTPIPEPAALGLIGVGAVLALRRRRHA